MEQTDGQIEGRTDRYIDPAPRIMRVRVVKFQSRLRSRS